MRDDRQRRGDGELLRCDLEDERREAIARRSSCGVKKLDSAMRALLGDRVRVGSDCALCWCRCCIGSSVGLGLLVRRGGERELEIIVLRHQLAILRRGGKRTQYTN